MSVPHGVVILDFGSQFTQLIARRIRELGVYSEILPFSAPLDEIKKRKPAGLILSGGPSSVYDAQAPLRNDVKALVETAPTLGICYGMQLLAHSFGGKVEACQSREYGRMPIQWEAGDRSLGSADGSAKPSAGGSVWPTGSQTVWMSHGDLVTGLPQGARGLAKSKSGHWAAMGHEGVGRGYWGLQFHPEVSHTERGREILEKFVFGTCGAKANWTGGQLVQHLVAEIQNKVGPQEKVLCALSGGVDSTVTASLLTRALGPERVHSVFVDTGLMRQNEAEEVLKAYGEMGLKVHGAFAEKEFLSELAGVEDPEKKRKIIGRVFIEVFEKATQSSPCQFLAQGTLYPDVIESVNVHGQSVTIKSHHNVGGLPAKMGLKLIEPLRELFKDEVRSLGAQLGVKPELLERHPFPGPGLAIRILGAVNRGDLDILRQADHIFISELKKHGLYQKIWQAFVVLLPVKTVGVMGDARTYEKVAGLRAVTSVDGMTADWYPFEHGFLAAVSNRITNEVRGINRVVYDISSKPPATIEWE